VKKENIMTTCTVSDNTQHEPSTRQDIYTRITAKIVAALEQGVRPWVRPWNAEHAAGRITRPLRHNGQPYTGINILSLWASATEQGFAAPIWMTYRQAVELGAHVRKGERGSPVVYANSITRAETDDSGVDVARDIHFLKGYTVFNVDQIDGLPEQYSAPAAPRTDTITRIAHAEEFFAATGADVSYGGSRAFYRPSTDSIVMPPIEAFKDAESYYATLAHETTHWTAHGSRLARDFGSRRFGSEGYAIEELVAELGAAFLCADLDLTLEPREDHAAYVANWLQVLENDNRAIFTAASHAQRAADFINGLQPATG
jgi:antirestriction protein ArdC